MISRCSDAGVVSAWAVWRGLPAAEREALARYGGVYDSKPSEADGVTPTSIEFAAHVFKEGQPTAFVFAQPSALIPLDLVEDRHVVVLDLFLEGCIRDIAAKAATLYIGDHHASGAKALLRLAADAYPQFGPILRDAPAGLAIACDEKSITVTNTRTGSPTTVLVVGAPRVAIDFDTDRRGPLIAWDRYNPGTAAPPLVAYVADLQAWALPQSRAINLALEVARHLASFPAIERLHGLWSTRGGLQTTATFRELVSKGAPYLECQEHLIGELGQTARPMTMASEGRTYNALVVNFPGGHRLAFELSGHLLSKIAPTYEKRGWRVDFAVAWHYDANDDRIYASCCGKKLDIDLSAVAASPAGGIKGGGYRYAAGFAIGGCDIKKVFSPAKVPDR